MKVKISKNKNLLSISFYKICYEKVKKLLDFLKVDYISIFIDKGYEYCFKDIVSVKDFTKSVIQLNESILIFDDEVMECLMDKEIEILSSKKILIDFNLGENMTHILINLNNTEITKEKVKEIMK